MAGSRDVGLPWRLVQWTVSHTVKPVLSHHLRRPRAWRTRGLELVVPPGVFHPRYFFSTGYFLSQLEARPLRDKRVLEIGCGSGILGLRAAQLGAHVVAVDLSPDAVRATRANAALNGLALDVRQSDVFASVPPEAFDLIVVNPPYFKRQPRSDQDLAWYCGENLEFFQRLFADAARFMAPDAQLLMVLSDACDRDGIAALATRGGLRFEEADARRFFWEWNFFYVARVR